MKSFSAEGGDWVTAQRLKSVSISTRRVTKGASFIYTLLVCKVVLACNTEFVGVYQDQAGREENGILGHISPAG